MLAGVTVRLVGALVDDVAKVVEPARARGASGGQPGLPALTALPPARSEAEDFGCDPATLERPGKDVGADRRDRDRPSAHRPGIVDQQRHHGVAEFGIALDLVA